MGRKLAFVYGLVSYLIFLLAFLYAIGFVGNIVVPKSVDSGVEGPLFQALIINGLLLSLFAVQHSVMARQWFKKRWTRVIPQPIERSTYVLLASLTLLLMYWQWQPIKSVVWNVDNPAARVLLQALFWAGWIGVLFSTYLIDHRALFGLRQVANYMKGLSEESLPFKTPALYRMVRHPLYLGFIVAFWSTPRMTVGHLFFAVMTTAYILVAIQFEERDLTSHYGEQYRSYRQRVWMLLPLPPRKPD